MRAGQRRIVASPHCTAQHATYQLVWTSALVAATRATELTAAPSASLLRDLAAAHHATGDTATAIEVATRGLEAAGEGESDLRAELEADLALYRGQ